MSGDSSFSYFIPPPIKRSPQYAVGNHDALSVGALWQVPARRSRHGGGSGRCHDGVRKDRASRRKKMPRPGETETAVCHAYTLRTLHRWFAMIFCLRPLFYSGALPAAFYKWTMIAAVSRHPRANYRRDSGEPLRRTASLCVGHVTRFAGLNVRPQAATRVNGSIAFAPETTQTMCGRIMERRTPSSYGMLGANNREA
jgi:hypothetical protein